MPAEFQKAMDYTLIGLMYTYCSLDDILIVSKGSLEEHKSYVMNFLERLDDKNLRINLPKSPFGKLEIDWLGYHISQLGIFWGPFLTSGNSFQILLKLVIPSAHCSKGHQNLSGQRNMRSVLMK